MANGVLWTFYGYRTPAGGNDVQDWYDGLSDEERDTATDTLAYLQHLEPHLWSKPEFHRLGDGLGELRFKVNELNRIFRIYSCFWPKRLCCSLLLGANKKKWNPKKTIAEARKRKSALEARTASIHEFKFT
jgi:hypothetical protein